MPNQYKIVPILLFNQCKYRTDFRNPEYRRDAKYAYRNELLSGIGEVNWRKVTDKMEIGKIMTTYFFLRIVSSLFAKIFNRINRISVKMNMLIILK